VARSTRITIETDSLLIFRGQTSSRLWCTGCAEEVEMFALEDTAVLSNLPAHEVDEWLNSGDLHRTRTPDGTELICLNSLLTRMGSGPTR
jgi:hypothetical protein